VARHAAAEEKSKKFNPPEDADGLIARQLQWT
jgi:hypothetical protein